jgi:hypothetical protein
VRTLLFASMIELRTMGKYHATRCQDGIARNVIAYRVIDGIASCNDLPKDCDEPFHIRLTADSHYPRVS